MNLAMQLRRAFITLGLSAIAMVCVVAKTAATTQVSAQVPVFESNPVSSVTISKETFVAPAGTLVRLGPPMQMSKNQSARRAVRVRCDLMVHG